MSSLKTTTIPGRFISLDVVLDRVGLDLPDLVQKIFEVDFPLSVMVNHLQFVFVEAEVDLWMVERVANREMEHHLFDVLG